MNRICVGSFSLADEPNKIDRKALRRHVKQQAATPGSNVDRAFDQFALAIAARVIDQVEEAARAS